MATRRHWYREEKSEALCEIRFEDDLQDAQNPDGLDEIVVIDQALDFHLESLDSNLWWFRVNGISVWLRAEGPISLQWEVQNAARVRPDQLTREEIEQINKLNRLHLATHPPEERDDAR